MINATVTDIDFKNVLLAKLWASEIKQLWCQQSF